MRHDVPVHPLYAKGFPSIGCGPCTRATFDCEDERAGRWWWEQDAEKECGIHITPNGQVMRLAEKKWTEAGAESPPPRRNSAFFLRSFDSRLFPSFSCGILELTMPVPTPGREGEASSLVLQELSAQPDLSASAEVPPAGRVARSRASLPRVAPPQFPAVRSRANRFAGRHLDAERRPSLAGLSADAFGIAIGHGLVLHPNSGVCFRRLGRAGGGPLLAAPAGGGDADPLHVPGPGAGGAHAQRQSASLAHSGAGRGAGNHQRVRYAGPAVAHYPDDQQRRIC